MQLFFNILDIASYAVAALAILGMLAILVRKFLVVASIDTGSIPKHQQEAVRQQLAATRLKRKFERAGGAANKFVKPVFQKFYEWMKSLIQSLVKLERQTSVLIAKTRHRKEDAQEKIVELKEIAQEAARAEDFTEAEAKYIEMISLNPQSVEAYKKLGDLYMEMKEYKSALETYGFIISLEKKQGTTQTIDGGAGSALADHYADVARAHIGLLEWSQALQNIDEALKFEPNNPKYLDLLFDISIQLKDVARGDEALTRLKEVNPENQKLEEFINRLAQIEK
ncbi:MAG: hypothetical protein COU31_04520 [Candidatus Magasanikbacteria bacterium CG10_big_fil_rev_8_21_14_0_10_40_10]|uniref:Uncharacterized protein n=1 Tax=Candidatus Magasanikbacteria bacterium CG10_big_fil_rev_8_21_14_0_10_40_10 TaxID=1974648 RepID=A0A2M6W2W1_9BACT|nr:MAG: hypothetical protein COU31_04520 [Candidatus Magasanikbacteria bacterium CG10_big_fil_rev_8_21_14_0_10_40_10]